MISRARPIIHRLRLWYTKYRRDLPWRRTHDPYKILVSEVMLQQTQVDRVIPKYHEFLHAFPTVHDLAKASPAAVIRVWSGLGYNRRAVYLQKTAQAIFSLHKGKFPQDLEQLKQLPGVGDYTARAILSFAFQKSIPLLDTNHRRFYQRVFFGLQKKSDTELLVKAEKIVEQAYSRQSVFLWNQAIMDFGSLVCTSNRPKCDMCPVQKYCQAYPAILTQTKEKKRKSLPFKQTKRYFRGQIIARLREQEALSLRSLVHSFSPLSPEQVQLMIKSLEKEGLVAIRHGRVSLPK